MGTRAHVPKSEVNFLKVRLSMLKRRYKMSRAYSFIYYVFNKQLLGCSDIPDSILGFGDIKMNKTWSLSSQKLLSL